MSFFGAARIYNSRGVAHIVRKRMVVEGEIIAATATAINSRVNAIKAAYSVDGSVAVLFTSAGQATDFQLGSGAIAGVKVVEGPTFLAQDGKAHFATGLPFTVALEADYLTGSSIYDGLVSYTESIACIGDGGARRVVIELDSGPPEEQFTSTNTPVTVIQAGEAVGIGSYPSFNSPIFPSALDRPDGYQVVRGTPRRDGYTYLEYPVRWSYRMTLANFTGIPSPLLR